MNTFIRNLKIAIYIIALLSIGTATSQEDDTKFWDNMRYGGSLGLNFGSGFFSATIAPSAIYQFNPTIATGIGLNATFNNLKDHYKSTILGGSLIGLVNVIPQIQLSGEFENLHVNRKYNADFNLIDDSYWVPALFLGAGYRSGNVTIGIRYDLLFNEDKSIYVDPWAPFVRFYF